MNVLFVSVEPEPFVVSDADEKVHSVLSAVPDSSNWWD